MKTTDKKLPRAIKLNGRAKRARLRPVETKREHPTEHMKKLSRLAKQRSEQAKAITHLRPSQYHKMSTLSSARRSAHTNIQAVAQEQRRLAAETSFPEISTKLIDSSVRKPNPGLALQSANSGAVSSGNTNTKATFKVKRTPITRGRALTVFEQTPFELAQQRPKGSPAFPEPMTLSIVKTVCLLAALIAAVVLIGEPSFAVD